MNGGLKQLGMQHRSKFSDTQQLEIQNTVLC